MEAVHDFSLPPISYAMMLSFPENTTVSGKGGTWKQIDMDWRKWELTC